MKVKYIKDKKYDGRVIWKMLKMNDPAGRWNRAKDMGISKEEVVKILEKENFSEARELIEGLVNKKYKEIENLIDEKIKANQLSWNKINNIFSEEIQKITDKKWKYKTYKVVLSPFHIGVSNLGENKVVRSVYEDSEDQKRITAHELLMSHLWVIFFEKYPKLIDKKMEDFWALNEITTTVILGLEKNLNCLWTKKTQGFDQYLKNYPQLEKNKKLLKDKYLKKKNFSSFLIEAIALI